MEEALLSLEQTVCDHCSTANAGNQKFCSACSFPMGGTDEEKNIFRTTIWAHKESLKEAGEKIKTAKMIIYAIAGLMLLMGLYQGFANDDFVTMIVDLFVALLYLILAAWGNRNAFGAILTAFIVYITLMVMNAFFAPVTLAQGIILKIFIIGAFVKGIRSAQEARTIMTQLEKVKAAPVGNY